MFINFVVSHYKAGDWELFYHDHKIASSSESQGSRQGPLKLRYEISRAVGDYDAAQQAIDEDAFKIMYEGRVLKKFESVYLDQHAIP